jgi:hypothetical protein
MDAMGIPPEESVPSLRAAFERTVLQIMYIAEDPEEGDSTGPGGFRFLEP